MTGAARRKFEAEVAIDYCQGSARRAETVFGWGRATVKAGLDELQTGTGRQDQFFKRGRPKTEEKFPDLEKDIRRLQIDLDKGPEQASNRTQFIKRLVEFADQNGRVIEWVYYPPYHSKYNSVERLSQKAMQPLESRLGRLPRLQKWSVEIFPLIGPQV